MTKHDILDDCDKLFMSRISYVGGGCDAAVDL